jgi:predicted metal-binding protein
MIIRDGVTVDMEDLVSLAGEAGFSRAGSLAMDALIFRPEVREMCAGDRCRNFGKSWSCPPAVGTPERAKERASEYHRGLIVQTTGELADDFDFASMREIMKKHCSSFDTLVRQIRRIFPGCLPMGAGACSRCRKCTYPDRPCRHPDKLYPSMEAYGLLVSDVCMKSGLGYNYGEGTMTYTSCVLID